MLHWLCKTHCVKLLCNTHPHGVKLFDVHARLNKVIFLMQHMLK